MWTTKGFLPLKNRNMIVPEFDFMTSLIREISRPLLNYSLYFSFRLRQRNAYSLFLHSTEDKILNVLKYRQYIAEFNDEPRPNLLFEYSWRNITADFLINIFHQF